MMWKMISTQPDHRGSRFISKTTQFDTQASLLSPGEDAKTLWRTARGLVLEPGAPEASTEQAVLSRCLDDIRVDINSLSEQPQISEQIRADIEKLRADVDTMENENDSVVEMADDPERRGKLEITLTFKLNTLVARLAKITAAANPKQALLDLVKEAQTLLCNEEKLKAISYQACVLSIS